MRSAVRIAKHEWIRQCRSISLAFDDRKSHKLLSFRCDAWTPAAPQGQVVGGEKHPAWRGGVVGCLASLRKMTLADMAEDYAVRTSEQVVALLRDFCTINGHLDEALFAKIKSSTRSLVTDGALLKTCHMLKLRALPNVVLVCRDPAHALRTAIKEPLCRTGRFQEQHKMLFEQRHALLKDIQYSQVWQAKLEDCQRLVVLRDGAQGGGVKHIMRHFAFAPHRFESFAAPRRKFACCINAIALLLADIAGDMRQERGARQRAEEMLSAFTARFIFEAGLSGDFSEEGTRFHLTSL
jgi:hypothetical protein